MKVTCEVCGTVGQMPLCDLYSGWSCKSCGQVYDYDEGCHIVLTDEQKRVLHAHHVMHREEWRVPRG